ASANDPQTHRPVIPAAHEIFVERCHAHQFLALPSGQYENGTASPVCFPPRSTPLPSQKNSVAATAGQQLVPHLSKRFQFFPVPMDHRFQHALVACLRCHNSSIRKTQSKSP